MPFETPPVIATVRHKALRSRREPASRYSRYSLRDQNRRWFRMCRDRWFMELAVRGILLALRRPEDASAPGIAYRARKTLWSFARAQAVESGVPLLGALYTQMHIAAYVAEFRRTNPVGDTHVAIVRTSHGAMLRWVP